MAQKVDLNEIYNLPDEEFKKSLFEWIEQMDITKELQSKLRSDLFQNFGKTALGRQIAVQHQQSQRIVLSPLVLVINTLVAEFLYAQNCHFSLSVFNSEVPYKNTLPDFERSHKFRFDSSELEEIIKALGLDHSETQKSEIIQTYKAPHERDGILIDTSLLFSIIKTLSSAVAESGKPQTDVKLLQQSLDVEDKCIHCKSSRKKPKKDELHSKYYKHFYKYLDLLSQHVLEISENTKKLKESKKEDDQHSRSSSKTCQLNKRLDKITESLKNLSKSNRKGRKITDIIKSVTRLTNEIERCSGNVAEYSKAINQSSKDVPQSIKTPSNYTEWLNQMTESPFGQRFIKNLELAQEKAVASEVQRIKEIFNEKFQTSRMLIKLHYKQKTLEKFRTTMQSSPGIQTRRDDFNELIDDKLRALKEKENYWKQTLGPTSVKVSSRPSDNDRISNAPEVVLNDRVSEFRGNTYESVIPTNSCRGESKPQTPVRSRKPINIEIFDEPLRPIEPVIDNMVQVANYRLQELENESEQLDKSFQLYLKKQNEQKQILADDIANVWEQYERAKDNMFKTFVVPERKNPSTSIHFNEAVIPIPTEQPIVAVLQSKPSLFENPYKKLHASLTSTGIPTHSDSSTIKKEIAIQANDRLPHLTVQRSENSSADKVSQIPIPMKIKSIMKKPKNIESKTHLTITKGTGDEHHLSDPSDASSYKNVKNASSSDVVHLSDSRPSDVSVKSKPSENSMNSIESNLLERFKKENGLPKNTKFEQSKMSTNDLSNQTVAAFNEVKTGSQEITALFEKIELKNQSTHQNTVSSSSESYEKINISTGHKSTSSDDFWK